MKLLPAFTDLNCDGVKGIDEGGHLSVCLSLFCSFSFNTDFSECFFHHLCFPHYPCLFVSLSLPICLSLSLSRILFSLIFVSSLDFSSLLCLAFFSLYVCCLSLFLSLLHVCLSDFRFILCLTLFSLYLILFSFLILPVPLLSLSLPCVCLSQLMTHINVLP